MKTIKFQILLNKNKNRVFGYAYYLCKNREDAEDITQDVFIKLWNNWKTIEPSKMQNWLMRVTHNSCMDQIRRRTSLFQKHMHSDRILQRDLKDPDETSGPEEIMIEKEFQHDFQEALSNLPDKMRGILLLHYFNGMRLEEIAETLNINLNTVKVTLHRGRKALRSVIVNDFPEVAEEVSHDVVL